MDLDVRWGEPGNVVIGLIAVYGMRVVGAILVLLLGWWASRFAFRTVSRLFSRARRFDPTVALFIANGARYAVIVLTFVGVLTTFGVATASFVAVLGALGLTIGLALQGTLSQLAAGIMLVLFRPFRIGDVIETGGQVGAIRVINLFYTEVETVDGSRVVLPNGKLWGDIVRVHTRGDHRRLDLRVQMPRHENIGNAIAFVRDLIGSDRRVRGEPVVGVESLNDNGFVVLAQPWVRVEDFQPVQFDLNRRLREALQQRETERQHKPASAA
ncbi:MAG: mechanosensitive ion channel family protein [Alphaproteobacteria bacterium]|nr:mechanosensitive ion channel family protein [Alphaproteobacteria bacterium]